MSSALTAIQKRAVVALSFAESTNRVDELTSHELALVMARLSALHSATTIITLNSELSPQEPEMDIVEALAMAVYYARYHQPFDGLYSLWGAHTLIGPVPEPDFGPEGVTTFAMLDVDLRLVTYNSPLQVVFEVSLAGTASLTALVMMIEAMRRVYRSSRGFSLDKAAIDLELSRLEADKAIEDQRVQAALRGLTEGQEQTTSLHLTGASVELADD